MTNTLTISTAPPQPAIKAALPAVYVDGVRRRDLKVVSIELSGPPTFACATLVTSADPQAPAESRVESVGLLPAIGSPVVIRAEAGGGVEVRGGVTRHRAKLAPEGEQVLVEVEHELAGALSQSLSSQWHVKGGSPVELANSRMCFNDGHDGLASDGYFAFGSRSTRLFDASAAATRWTVADALAYLLAVAAPREVTAPSLDELGALAGGIDLERLDVTGLSAAEAIAKVAERGGLGVRAAREGVGIVFYRPGIDGRSATVSLQPAGEQFDPSRSNLLGGSAAFACRPARRPVLAWGSAKRYEATFQMQPGWDSSLETSRWRDFVRSMSGNWPVVGDVYRKWVLNEHGWYATSPYNLPVAGFSSVGGGDFLLDWPRTFLPCLSCDPTGQSLGVVVETRCGASESWRRWRGPLWVSRDECAIYLGGDGLPGEFFQASVAGDAEVRVTATVASDARLSVQVEGDAHLPTAVVDAGSRVGWSAVHSSSIFSGASGLGSPAERDDSAALAELAERRSEVLAAASEAEFTLGWIDMTPAVGDRVELIEGRALELASTDASRPHIRRVRHDFAAQRTAISVEG